MTDITTIDVRTVVPRERHPLIFSTLGPEVWKVRIGRPG